ncbi:MAG TPA: hypothetical protein VGX96_20010 [Candidatus Elarobacter sp.]|jgi:hypothetical protein|nr:hypothetical protein [Candidatus Elarobacter sp.]
MSNVLKKFVTPAFALAMFAGVPAVVNAACLICNTITQCDDTGKCKSVTTCAIERDPKVCLEQE